MLNEAAVPSAAGFWRSTAQFDLAERGERPNSTHFLMADQSAVITLTQRSCPCVAREWACPNATILMEPPGDINKMLVELRSERQAVEEAITTLERLSFIRARSLARATSRVEVSGSRDVGDRPVPRTNQSKDAS